MMPTSKMWIAKALWDNRWYVTLQILWTIRKALHQTYNTCSGSRWVYIGKAWRARFSRSSLEMLARHVKIIIAPAQIYSHIWRGGVVPRAQPCQQSWSSGAKKNVRMPSNAVEPNRANQLWEHCSGLSVLSLLIIVECFGIASSHERICQECRSRVYSFANRHDTELDTPGSQSSCQCPRLQLEHMACIDNHFGFNRFPPASPIFTPRSTNHALTDSIPRWSWCMWYPWANRTYPRRKASKPPFQSSYLQSSKMMLMRISKSERKQSSKRATRHGLHDGWPGMTYPIWYYDESRIIY